MIALAHYEENTGQLLGVWLPPRGVENEPQGYYLDDDLRRAIEPTVKAKGTKPTWDDWFDQLGEGLPYGGLLVAYEVSPDVTVALLPESLATSEQVVRLLRHLVTKPLARPKESSD